MIHFPLHGKDFYKSGHKDQYPVGSQRVYSNFTARSNKHFNWEQAGKGYVVLWGLQGFIQEFLIDWWGDEFFGKDKDKVCKKYYRRLKNSVADISVKHMEALHDLGYLPVKIKALPEGTLVPIGVPAFTIVNTDDSFEWVTNMLETLISTEMWKPITTATIAYEYLKLCTTYSNKTCDNNEHLPFQCHDFSMRGMSGLHDAACSGSGHLLSFAGTDTIPAIDYLEEYYGADSDKELVGASVPATEHSVMCMGSKDGEESTVKRFLTDVYPTGIFSCVLDTWDFFKVLTEMLPRLKDIIMAREGKFVVRPDSGDPVDIICGYKVVTGYDHLGKTGSYFTSDKEAHDIGLYKACGGVNSKGIAVYYHGKYYDSKTAKELSEPEVKGAIELLWETFGGIKNSKGYKVLDEHIGLIYGDSITLERASEIFKRLEAKGFASSNVVFGVGSFTYQYITRDTFGIAIKATWGVINGESVDIQKDPATDDGTKKSLCGRIMVYRDKDTGLITAKDQCDEREETLGMLKTVFKDGKAYRKQTLTEVRKALHSTV